MTMLGSLLRSLFRPAVGGAGADARAPEGHPPPALVASGADYLRVRRCRHGLMAYSRHDEYIGRSLELYGEFSEIECGFLARWLRADDVVIDAGANIGALTVPLARAVGRGGRVIAYEPQRVVFQLLCANVALNELTQVETRRAALGARAGSARVPCPSPRVPGNFGGTRVGEQGEPVAVETIDDLGLAACRLIKADVEGMEAHVLEGARATISRARPLLYLENDRLDRSPQLIALVRALGYRAWWHLPPLYNPANYARNGANVFRGIASANMFCTPEESGIRPAELAEVAGPEDTWQGKRPSTEAGDGR
jgi:FkbM family methyltransferase